MKKSLLMGCSIALGLWILPAEALADCCQFTASPCAARDHVDARCDAGTKGEGHLSNVFECWTAGFIAISPLDPLFYVPALVVGELYCNGAADQTCTPVLSDSECSDTDKDGLFNLWETTGIDGDGDGAVDVTLPGADPNRVDLFVEIDCLADDDNDDGDLSDTVDHSHCPQQAAIEAVVQSFANAPRENHDKTSGIQLHIDTGSLYGAGTIVTVQGSGGVSGTFGDLGGGGDIIAEDGNTVIDWDGAAGRPGTSFYDLKKDYFNASRAQAFRYALFAHQTNARATENDCTSGWAEVPGNDLFVTLGGTNANGDPCNATDANGFSVGNVNRQAGTFMHELGHCLGLRHGGDDDVNLKPNYLSVMNYSFQSCNVPASPKKPHVLPGGCDYSPIALASLAEPSLDECVGIDGDELGFGASDWDGDGIIEGVTCQPATANSSAELNHDDGCVNAGDDSVLQSMSAGDDVAPPGSRVIRDGPNFTCDTAAVGGDVQEKAVGAVQPTLTGLNDWANLVFNFQGLNSFADGVSSSADIIDADSDELEAARQHMSMILRPVVDVQVSAPAGVLPGEVLQFGVRFSSVGRGPALEGAWINQDPAGSQVSFGLGALRVGEVYDFVTTFTVPPDACPMSLVNTAMIEYEDIVGEVYTVQETAASTVLDLVPPIIALAGPAEVVLECGVDGYIEAGATAHDACDPDVPVTIGGDTVVPGQVGTYVVEYSAQDDWENQSFTEAVVTVADTTSPEFSVTVTPSVLTPPNHKMVEITPAFQVSDACDPSPVVELLTITASESANGTGDGNTKSDILVDGAGRIFLRAERAGTGSSRTYTLTFRATDATGNETTATATVTVPKNK